MSEARQLYEKLSDEFIFHGIRSTSWSALEELYKKAEAYENKKQKADLLAKAVDSFLGVNWQLREKAAWWEDLRKALAEYNSEK